MSYPDPYYAPEHRQFSNNYSTQQQQLPQQQQQPYRDVDFDPYNNHPQHPTYDQSGYNDDDAFRNASPDGGLGQAREKGRFDDGFNTLRPNTSGGLRSWRKEFRGPLWTAGGRGKCFFRFFCCSILIFIFLLVSIVLTLGIWIRPPDITINQVGLNSTGGSAAQVSASTFTLNFAVNISVENPNYFSVAFRDIKADLTYPTNNMDLGGGEKDDIVFKSHTETTFNFPFALQYDLSKDTNQTVLKDLLSKCGFTGTKQNINVNYKITLGLRILFVTVSPAITNSFSFECPSDEIQSFLQGAGINLGSLTGGGSG
ncbi:uncharacterized protein FOMMEDRAFT_168909 [Fomitiporia mediterranea MF3/22]|uniref:uncharacterized protein n=1 Tax=Fomitiporia mediterranea (strain MF3/22) TaxID=694068 RepID=UPI0004408379|nr:uncharacterized protein FOMMEDRAFT_168909 [Fomitiporia mediterranea MF3/22]EJD02453.1 hypothetical protein FOMMEDRAFT_168909 [Fomitiporia mediterranea MF3/22]